MITASISDFEQFLLGVDLFLPPPFTRSVINKIAHILQSNRVYYEAIVNRIQKQNRWNLRYDHFRFFFFFFFFFWGGGGDPLTLVLIIVTNNKPLVSQISSSVTMLCRGRVLRLTSRFDVLPHKDRNCNNDLF